MKVNCVWEHNGDDTILYSSNFVGAFTRGKSRSEAIQKMPSEIMSYLKWKGDLISDEYSCAVTPQVRQTGNRLSGLAGTAYASLLA